MTQPNPGTPLDYFVEGMDCATCVRKVEGLLERLPGTAETHTNLMTQNLRLRLDESQTSRATLEARLRELGYPPRLMTEEAAPAHPAPWYTSGQGRLVLVSGVLLALAWLFGLVEPRLGFWGYLAATLLGVWPLARKAWAAARAGEPFSIGTLVTLAALGALVIGQAAEAAVVVFLFAVGELLEGVAVGRSRSGIRALARLAPQTARVLKKGAEFELPVDALHVGDLVRVRPGDRLPADGTITAGASSLDESPVTGESLPVSRGVGEAVYAGSINGEGVLDVRVERESRDNTIARIIHLVEEAGASKAPVARFIDRFSRVYTPFVVLAAALTATLPLLFGGEWHTWLYRGIALLLIGCPCALVLSVPAAITSAVAAGTRRGLLIKGGALLEAAGSVKTVAFDKTGTLTLGRPKVTQVIGLKVSESEVLRLAAAVEADSNHPLARAVVEHAKELELDVPAATDGQALPGQGVSAVVEGRILTVASPSYAKAALDADTSAHIATLEGEGRTVVVLLDGGAALGLLALRDEPRADARQAISELHALGVRPVMLSGDNPRTATAIARDLGLERGEVQAGLLPADKLRLIGELRGSGPVMMVGDGINDAPALAASDVGVAMGGGTDVALETAGVALLRPRVTGVPELLHLSRATMGIIRQNVAFAVGLKLVFLVTTLLGITGLWPAVLSDTGATALVTLNALRLLRWHGPRMRRVDLPVSVPRLPETA